VIRKLSRLRELRRPAKEVELTLRTPARDQTQIALVRTTARSTVAKAAEPTPTNNKLTTTG
jgi:hypothetical protein